MGANEKEPFFKATSAWLFVIFPPDSDRKRWGSRPWPVGEKCGSGFCSWDRLGGWKDSERAKGKEITRYRHSVRTGFVIRNTVSNFLLSYSSTIKSFSLARFRERKAEKPKPKPAKSMAWHLAALGQCGAVGPISSRKMVR